MKLIASITLFFLIISSANAEEIKPRNGLPKTLWKSAHENNCDDLTNFYEIIETQSPPYAFEIIPSNYSSAIYICDIKKNKMIIWQRDDEWVKPKYFSCSTTLEPNRSGYAGGLSVTEKIVNMSKYYELASEGWVKGPDIEANAILIESTSDGLSSVFVCHNKKWYFNNYD